MKSLVKLVQLYRNDAMYALARAEKDFIRARLDSLGAVIPEDLDRFQRRQMNEDLKNDSLVSALRESYKGWKEVYEALKKGIENDG